MTHHIFQISALTVTHSIITLQIQRHNFRGILEGILAQMGISLGGGYVGMAQQFLDLIQASAVVYEYRGKIMAKIMDTNIGNPGPFAYFIPGMIAYYVCPTCLWTAKYVLAAVYPPPFQ
jgi:hypothetical protein